MSNLKAVLHLLSRGDKILASFLILSSMLSFTVLKAFKQPGQTALIKVGNLQKFNKNLDRAEKFFVSGHISETAIEIVDGEIRIISSDCPQKLCIRQGSIRQIGEIIVCVPNKLIISIGGTRKNKFDAVTG